MQFTNRGIIDKSPYIFKYNYPEAIEGKKYPTIYESLQDEYNNLTDQNPDYNRYLTDGWGFYQKNGAQRQIEMKTWIDQDVTDFDPAAWHLKVIELPSGGEIHVQYEQKDYSYVQNKPAQVMVSISSKIDNRYFLNTDEIGVKTLEEKKALVKLINDHYYNDWRKIYFKFLYNLSGESPAEIQDCDAEYITGYANLVAAEIDFNTQEVYIELPNDYEYTPEKVCKDFYITQRRGHVNSDCNNPKQYFTSNQSAEQMLKSFDTFKNHSDPNACQYVNLEHSYFRVPTPISKKGGGVRVKRLLTYSLGLESDALLYGKEYHYVTYDDATKTVRSSGVATNEPNSFREENALVDADIDKAKTQDAKIIGGDIQKEFEGPLGESLLPGPSIGYQRVIVTDIHKGQTNPGFTVHEFNTAKDYPMQHAYSKMDRAPYIDNGTDDIFNVHMEDNQKVAQGFVFKLNDMHGKPKSNHTYSGIITSEEDLGSLNGMVASLSTSYEYYPFSQPIPVMDNYTGTLVSEFIGKDMEINVAHKAIEDHVVDHNIEMDYTMSAWGPFLIPLITAIPTTLTRFNDYFCHVTSKVIHYPSFVKRTITYKDGIKHIAENQAFDKYTGRPVLVKSYDEYTGAFLKQQIPASWEYESMRNKSINEGKRFSNLLNYFQDGEVEYLSINGNDAIVCENIDFFYKGDVLDLGSGHVYHVLDVNKGANQIKITKSQLHNGGNPGAIINEATILRSGLRNELKAAVGDIVFHSEDENFSKPVITEAEKLETSSFTNDLNVALQEANQQNGTLSLLSGVYNLMDVAAFANEINFECPGDLTNKNIKDVLFNYEKFVNEGNLELNLVSFWIECDDNQWEKVEAIGN